MSNPKETGSYYTPKILSDFLIGHIFNEYVKDNRINILEPSCGDGQFLSSLFSKKVLGEKKVDIRLIDINVGELTKASKICEENKNKDVKFEAIKNDFLEYQSADLNRYSLIIGNPPYIKKNYLTESQIKTCKKIHKNSGLEIEEIKNIWPAFLLSSIRLLNDTGALCLVLPSELLQVKYTKVLRSHILSSFEKIEIFAFNELIFSNIEQDVVVFVGAKNVAEKEKGVSFYQVEKLKDLKEPLYTKKHSNVHRTTLDKWTNYILSDEELMFIESKKQPLNKVKDYCTNVEVGIVTAANSYFIVNDKTLETNDLKEYARPILSKSLNIKKKIIFDNNDLKHLRHAGKPINLIAFENIQQNKLKKNALAYIKKGLALKLHQKYKFKKRTHWHHVPSIWVSEGFFTKRSHLFPRIIVNEAKVLVTDSFYRINMKKAYAIKNLAFSFFNTLSLILCELEGRYYGGGVLELTPNEFKAISIPYMNNVTEGQFNKLNSLIQSKSSIEEVLKYTDKIILGDFLKICDEDISKLKVIYSKLVKRRLKQPLFDKK
jgi:adenine-specific DNA-methyltransferase